MTTLVERLRSANATGGVADKYNEAADRIEELELQITAYKKSTLRTIEQFAERDAQITLLREAMEKAANEIRRCDYTPARSTLLVALAATEEKK